VGDAILVLNAGSSSLKFATYAVEPDTPALRISGEIEGLHARARFAARDAAGGLLAERAWDDAPGHAGALDFLLGWLREALGGARLLGVGHRVVHGGSDFAAPVRVTPQVLDRLEALIPLAPLHQPHGLAPIRALAAREPDLPQVACFDTAFHATAPEVAQAFALPPEVTARGVRRYGFHGLSYDYVASALARHDPASAAGRAVVLHLGAGASMCALSGGRSVATTMGLTALDGLPMATRCGALDPGVVLYLMREMGMDADAIEDLLYRRSGLLGVSGLSGDMRELLASPAPRARFAVELFVHRIARELGSLAAALEGLDAVVFTAGIGENAPAIRRGVAERAAWLGLTLDAEANAGSGARRISAPGSRVAAWVIPTDEQAVIARQVQATLA
jgi:acetate kinase